MNDSFEEKEQQENPPQMSSNQRHPIPNRPQKPIIGGIIIIIVGLALLIQKIPGIDKMIPTWLFTWPMILILIGIFAVIKNRSLLGGSIPFLIGLFFLLNNAHIINASFQPFLLPILIILFGVFIVLSRNKKNRFHACRTNARMQRRDYYRRQFRNRLPHMPPEAFNPHFHQSTQNPHNSQADSPENDEDYLDMNSVFGSAEKNYFSKNFKGGDITCVFGGGKVNLAQSDIQGIAVLNLSINFGGIELLVPANWVIKNELNALFGGIEDKRLSCPTSNEDKKVLVLKGNVLCGGIEIRS